MSLFSLQRFRCKQRAGFPPREIEDRLGTVPLVYWKGLFSARENGDRAGTVPFKFTEEELRERDDVIFFYNCTVCKASEYGIMSPEKSKMIMLQMQW